MSDATTTTAPDTRHLNLTVLVGRLARPPRQRILPSGDGLVEYEVTVRRPGQRAETVPVVWPDAPAAALDPTTDSVVVVVGRVRRRFFRSGGATASRTEVVAERVVPARHARRARSALLAAESRVAEAVSA